VRPRLSSPCSRGKPSVARQVAAQSVPHHGAEGTGIDDLISSEKKWQIGIKMQKTLREAVKVEDFSTAAQCRDAIAALQLSPIQLIEIKMAEQLIDGTYDEKAKSLRKLSQLNPAEETQALIIEAIKDEALTVWPAQIDKLDT
jgi:hypothetical protein